MPDLLSDMAEALERTRLIPPAAGLLVAVSGGADSMVLLELLRRLAYSQGWKLVAAHFNHQLRGRASDADAALVRRYCQKHRVPFVTGKWARSAQQRAIQRLGYEAAAREARLNFLRATARRRRLTLVATAHHADDQAELFFLRLFRGAGSEGLAGMSECDPFPGAPELHWVRPLLAVGREALRDFAAAEKVPFREDASNANIRHERNWVRRELLPVIKARHGEQVGQGIRRTMQLLGSEAEFVQQAAQAWQGASSDARPAFAELSVAVQRRVLLDALLAQGVVPDFAAIEFFRTRLGEPWTVQPGLILEHVGQGELVSVETEMLRHRTDRFTIHLEGKAGRCEWGGRILSWERKDVPEGAPVPPRKAGQECFDADRLGSKLILRHWQPGDRFQPIGLAKAAKLQDLFTNAKVPRAERRERLVAVASGGELVWVEGLRLGEWAKMAPKTRQIVIWQWQKTDYAARTKQGNP